MKKAMMAMVLALILVFAGTALAQKQVTITFGWQQTVEDILAGWKLYRSTAPNVEVSADNLVLTIPYDGEEKPEYEGDYVMTSPDGQIVTYYFVLTAYATNGAESGASNEVFTDIDFRVPGSPVEFRLIVTVQPE